ncbi:putative endonuclease [Port-miou virus]|uniref:Putative endonuclease n=1 Tax=Port-miou virus TaxID=1733873 RepID=A0A0N9PVV4_9VIRU|nr:putative endonuclease [Port-miou virus]
MNCETMTRGNLCGRMTCKPCFSRSFASVENSRYMMEGQIDPLLITKNSHEKLEFLCPKCKHSFSARPYNITAGHFCPFCTNKLCSSEDCKRCFDRSFASHKKAKFWSTSKNGQSPREVFKISGKKFWFDCEVCGHSFQAMLSNVVAGCFCPYCPRRKLCDDEDCEMCLKNSFASRERAKCWCYEKNKVRPRDVFPYSNKKYWFNCDKCSHSFETALSSVVTADFCPFCSNKRLCKSEDCKQCFEKSFASHKYSGQWLHEKNKKTPREVFISSGKKVWFECKVCVHTFELSPNTISTTGCFCPFCSGVRICLEDDCEMCFNRSFASHEKAKHWLVEKNGRHPREVFKGHNKNIGSNAKRNTHFPVF